MYLLQVVDIDQQLCVRLYHVQWGVDADTDEVISVEWSACDQAQRRLPLYSFILYRPIKMQSVVCGYQSVRAINTCSFCSRPLKVNLWPA